MQETNGIVGVSVQDFSLKIYTQKIWCKVWIYDTENTEKLGTIGSKILTVGPNEDPKMCVTENQSDRFDACLST